VIVSEKVKSGGAKSPPPRQTQQPQNQIIRRPVTAIRKKPKHQSFADGVKSLIKAIKTML
jgi:hypothetical protein